MRLHVVISPSGGGCRHVHLIDVARPGSIVVTTLDDWSKLVDADDDVVLASVKAIVRGASPNLPPQAIAALIEAREL